jgi:cell division protein FtsQ
VRKLPLAAAVFGAVCFLVLTDGGRHTRQAEPLLVQVDRLAEQVGLGLQQAWISGHRNTSDRDVADALGMSQARSLIAFDKEAARTRLENLPWVREARVLKVWPHRVEVQLREYRPFAVWRHADHDVLITDEGRRLARIGVGTVKGLPVVAGVGAERNVANLVRTILSNNDALARDLLVAEWVGERRWTLHLAGGRRIHLPEKDAARSYATVVGAVRGERAWPRDFKVLDLRDPRYVRLRMSDLPSQREPS